MMPRYFLFGLIRVPMWEYRCGLTIAQIELLTIDTPIIVYKRNDNKPKPGEKGYTVSSDQAEKAYFEWLQRKKKRGRKIDFQHLLATGEQRNIE